MNRTKSFLAVVAALVVGGSVEAAVTLPAFNPSPSQVSTTWRNQDLVSLNGGSIPAGTYVSATVLLDWVGGGINSQWSNEVRARVTSAAASGTGTTPTVPAGTVLYSAVTGTGNLVGAAGNGNNVTDLRINIPFTIAYPGGTSPLFLNFRQSFAGTNANWTNVRVTLNEPVIPASTGVVLGGAVMTTITGTQVQWYSFTVATAGTYVFDTAGSVRTDVANTALDTELGLYSASGALVATNDDDGALLTSRISQALTPGTYYLAASLFDTSFGVGFGVTSAATATRTGNLIINGIAIPEPAALGLLAPMAMLLGRRRNA